MSLSISRRSMLRALGLGAAAAMPVFRSGIGWGAEDTALAKRFIAFKYNNGTQPWNWFLEGAGDDTPLEILSPLLQPFEAVKSKLLVFEGLAFACSEPGSSHDRGMHCMLSGTESSGTPDVPEHHAAGGMTIDHHMAGILGSQTKFPSLQLGVRSQSRTLSFSGPNTPLPSDDDPWRVYQNVFAGLSGAGDPEAAAALERLRAQRRSVLDHAAKELIALPPLLSADDRVRLEIHLDSIRQLEQSLDKGAAAGCVDPSLPPGSLEEVDTAVISRLQIDLLVAALVCDLTRIATFTWGWGAHFDLDFLGISEALHPLSHEPHDDETLQAQYSKVLTFFSSELAYFLERLDAIPGTAGGTFLDESLVLLGTDNRDGKSHRVDNIPFLLAGSGGGQFRTGRYLRYADPTPHNGLLISLCEAMGTPVETFGNPAHCNGPLPNLQ